MSNRKRRKRKQVRRGKRQGPNSAYGQNNSTRPTGNRSDPSSQLSLGGMFEQGSQNTLDLIDRMPRVFTVLNVGTYVLQGVALGLAMGLIASLGTRGFPKIWTYVANTFTVMLLRVILQWIWVLGVTTWVRKMATWFIRDRTGQELPENVGRRIPVTNNVGTIVGPAIVAVGIATILATENVEPSWLTRTWAIVLMSALGGGLASAMEALGLPSNIHALRWGRHTYQDNPNFRERANRQRTNRNRR